MLFGQFSPSSPATPHPTGSLPPSASTTQHTNSVISTHPLGELSPACPPQAPTLLYDQPPQPKVDTQPLDFNSIREWCKIEKPTEATISPHELCENRKQTWPDMNPNMPSDLCYIYQAVKKTGLPNCVLAKIPLSTGINVAAWRDMADGSPEENELINFIEFGFPIGYNGPASHTQTPVNHASAIQYPDHVHHFIEQEVAHGAICISEFGPIFSPWQHTSPMMTRPKSDPQKRRIITDLSFPQEQSINAYIKKNCSMGRNQEHSLPTVQAVVEEVKRVGPGATLFTIDIHRAYKNFRACPLDWPLLNIAWTDQHGQNITALDMAMPFGSKLSSLYFQRVANFVTRVLGEKGIKSFMYLDDLIVFALTLSLLTTNLTQLGNCSDSWDFLRLPARPSPHQTRSPSSA